MATGKRVYSWVVTEDFWRRSFVVLNHIAAGIIVFREIKLAVNQICG
jgi:hypothetical protein